MRKILLALGLAVFSIPAVAAADGCYTCGSGSSSSCKDYCQYSGSDTFDARKKCEAKGCKVSGTSSCPSAANYKVCMAPTPTAPILACR